MFLHKKTGIVCLSEASKFFGSLIDHLGGDIIFQTKIVTLRLGEAMDRSVRHYVIDQRLKSSPPTDKIIGSKKIRMRHLCTFIALSLLLSITLFGQSENAVISDADIARLPIPVQRYLRYTKTIGKPFVTRVELTQSGQMKLKPDAEWIPLHAKQWYRVPEVAFEWQGWVKAAPLFHVKATDFYDNGVGSLKIRLWGFIPMGTAEGPEVSEGELMRYLSEIIWFPPAMLGENIAWEAVNDTLARATITDGGLEVSGDFHFDPDGRLTAFTAIRYADMGDGEFRLADWYAPVSEYADFNGWYLPSKGSAVWLFEEGDYEYIRLKIESISLK